MCVLHAFITQMYGKQFELVYYYITGYLLPITFILCINDFQKGHTLPILLRLCSETGRVSTRSSKPVNTSLAVYIVEACIIYEPRYSYVMDGPYIFYQIWH